MAFRILSVTVRVSVGGRVGCCVCVVDVLLVVPEFAVPDSTGSVSARCRLTRSFHSVTAHYTLHSAK